MAAAGMPVAMSGRTSSLICGSVISAQTTIQVDYPATCGNPTAFTQTFSNQVITSLPAQPGDSGSLIVTSDTARPVALLTASSGTFSGGSAVGDVLTALHNVTGEHLFVGRRE